MKDVWYKTIQNQSQSVYIKALSVLFYAHYIVVGIEMVLSIKKMLTQLFNWVKAECATEIFRQIIIFFSLHIL